VPILDNREAHLTRFEALRQSRDLRTAAFDMVGGGDYERVGFTEQYLLDTFAPVPENGLLVDVGCGPGRLARYLTERPRLRYLGTDIVPELLDVARTECLRPDWRFEAVTGFEIPCESGSADVVTIFSIFTNMLPEQSFLLVREAARVLRPGGTVLITYFDISFPGHNQIFLNLVEHQAQRIDPLVFLNRDFIETFATGNGLTLKLNLSPEEARTNDTRRFRLLDGREVEDKLTLNQALAILSKP
jgi:SAM-dependent methyltransferase